MKCKKCLNEIDENEIYCDSCKKNLKQEIELNKLIDDNLELNKLEITKEIEILHPLNDEDFNSIQTQEELNNIVKINEIEKKDKKKIIIISIVFISLIVSILLLFLLLFQNKSNEIEVEEIDYKSILNEYGILLEKTIKEYSQINNEIPSWDALKGTIDYRKHNIICNIHDVYEDGSIYLNECEIDNNSIEYSYGNKKNKKKVKEIEIYKNIMEDTSFVYSDKQSDILVGRITCQTENCEFIKAYEEYALIKDLEQYYLYNYINNTITIGPFDIDDIENNIFSYENILYGMLYNINNKQKIYSIKTDKSFDKINGTLLTLSNTFEPKLMFKYGYVMFKEDENYEFVSLNTGKVAYTISESINSFIESKENKIVYITTYNFLNSKITIYNSNGKKLFDGKEYDSFRLYNDKIIIHNDYNFFVYDLNLKLLLNSRNYENILNYYEDMFLVINDGYLQVVNISDNVVIDFDFKWDVNYIFDNAVSSFEKKDKDFIITIVIKDSIENINYNLIYNSKTKNIKITKI